MKYKRTRITVKETNPKTYPNLLKNYPYSYEINGKEWPDKDKRILGDVARYLLNNPERFIIFKNKLPREALGMALDTLVKAHNFSLKLAGRKKISKEEISGMTLETLIKGQNLIRKFGGGIRYLGIIKAKKFLKEVAEE